MAQTAAGTGRKSRPSLDEVVRECKEDGSGWRVDKFGDWWPCKDIGPLPTREEYRAKKAQEAGEA